MDLRVLTWNTLPDRAIPRAEGDRYDAFAAALNAWEWDVALLQEIPPRWLGPLRDALHGEACGVLSSGAGVIGLRRALAVRAPALTRGPSAGANAIIARSDRIIAARSRRLGRLPRQRRVHGVALACGVWVSTLRASSVPAAAESDLSAAVRASWEWAHAERMTLILGGDLGTPAPVAEELQTAASSASDHVLCGPGIEIRSESVARLDQHDLSEHSPLAVTLMI